MIKNPKMGFTRLFGQKMIEGGSPVDTILESNYVLLNQLVYMDLLKKSMIRDNDTVYLVNKDTESVQQKTIQSSEVKNYLSYWR
jgi:hypothetical protein